MVQCPNCGTEVSDRGLSNHLTRWCKSRLSVTENVLDQRRKRQRHESPTATGVENHPLPQSSTPQPSQTPSEHPSEHYHGDVSRFFNI
jgi:hypothetical protein